MKHMPTTVRVDDPEKRELDRLQGLIQAETGQRLSHSQLLARLLRLARGHTKELMQSSSLEWRPPTREQLGRVLESLPRTGVRTDASRVDEILYGGSPHE